PRHSDSQEVPPELPMRPLRIESDEARLEALSRYQIHSVEPDSFLDDFTRLAAEVCESAIALLSIAGSDEIQHISRFGARLDNGQNADSLIWRAIIDQELFVALDLLPSVRFYAGAPLRTTDGYAIGVLSVIDQKPRQLTQSQARALSSLANA